MEVSAFLDARRPCKDCVLPRARRHFSSNSKRHVGRRDEGDEPGWAMLRLKPRQRSVIVEKLPDLANIGAGVLVFGQFVGGEATSTWSMLIGAALWLGIFGWVLVLAGGRR